MFLEDLVNLAKRKWHCVDICQFYLQMWFQCVVSHSAWSLRDHNQITVMFSRKEYSYKAETKAVALIVAPPNGNVSYNQKWHQTHKGNLK